MIKLMTRNLREKLIALGQQPRRAKPKHSRRTILFVLPSLSGGGAERVLLTASTHFPPEKYRKLLLILTDKGEVIEDIPQFEKVSRAHAERTFSSLIYLTKYISRERPDVIFSTLLRSHVAVYIASRLIPFRSALIMRSPNVPSEYLNGTEWRGLAAKLLSYSYRAADLTIAQTAEMAGQIIEKHGISEKRVKVASNPLDLSRVRRLAAQKGDAFSPRAELEIVAVGRLTHQKGLDFLLESVAELVKTGIQARLHIVGADVENRQVDLERLAVSLGIDNKVVFLGFQANPYRYIRSADVLAISSRYEGFPNTLLEAIALETPAVCTRCADGLDALLEGGRNGILVEMGNKAEFARALLSANSIRSFQLPKMSDYEQLFDLVLRESRATD